MITIKKWRHVFLGLALIAQPLYADINQYQELDALRSQNALLTEAVKNAELKCRLNNGGKDCASLSTQPQPSMPLPNVGVQPIKPSTAQVESVSGVDEHKTALILLPDGSQIKAHVGKKIAGLGKIKSISIHDVVVEQGGKTSSLPFVSDLEANIMPPLRMR